MRAELVEAEPALGLESTRTSDPGEEPGNTTALAAEEGLLLDAIDDDPALGPFERLAARYRLANELTVDRAHAAGLDAVSDARSLEDRNRDLRREVTDESLSSGDVSAMEAAATAHLAGRTDLSPGAPRRPGRS